MAQISSLRKEHEAAEKKRNEIEKIALILGLIPSDRPRRAARPPEDQEDEPEKKTREAQRSPEGRPAAMKVQSSSRGGRREVLLMLSYASSSCRAARWSHRVCSCGTSSWSTAGRRLIDGSLAPVDKETWKNRCECSR